MTHALAVQINRAVGANRHSSKPRRTDPVAATMTCAATSVACDLVAPTTTIARPVSRPAARSTRPAPAASARAPAAKKGARAKERECEPEERMNRDVDVIGDGCAGKASQISRIQEQKHKAGDEQRQLRPFLPGSARGHAEPRTWKSAARHQRQFAARPLRVGPAASAGEIAAPDSYCGISRRQWEVTAALAAAREQGVASRGPRAP